MSNVGDGLETPPRGLPLNVTEAAYRAIKEDLIRCVLPPGGRVTEGQLCRRYDLGHTPVRIGLQRLQAEGLVESEARHGWLVQPIRPRQVLESCAVRLLLEPEAASLAAGHISPTTASQLRDLCEIEYQPESPSSVSDYLEANTNLHTIIAQASGNSRLAAIVSTLLRNDERLFHFGFRLANYGDQITDEHHRLVGAVVGGDAALARELTQTQITNTRSVIMDGLLAAAAMQGPETSGFTERTSTDLALTPWGAQLTSPYPRRHEL
ncbi:MAG: GntR family transcriptional regulator [Candidatus Dormibacteria bacterium]